MPTPSLSSGISIFRIKFNSDVDKKWDNDENVPKKKNEKDADNYVTKAQPPFRNSLGAKFRPSLPETALHSLASGPATEGICTYFCAGYCSHERKVSDG